VSRSERILLKWRTLVAEPIRQCRRVTAHFLCPMGKHCCLLHHFSVSKKVQIDFFSISYWTLATFIAVNANIAMPLLKPWQNSIFSQSIVSFWGSPYETRRRGPLGLTCPRSPDVHFCRPTLSDLPPPMVMGESVMARYVTQNLSIVLFLRRL